MDEILGPLRSALDDPSPYVRVGAVNSLYRIASKTAAELLLDEHAAALSSTAPADEVAALGAQLARTRSGRAAELAARLLNADQLAVLDVLNTGDAARWAGYVDTEAKGAGLPDYAKEMLVSYSHAWAGLGDDMTGRARSVSDADRNRNARDAIEHWQEVYDLDGVPQQSMQKLYNTMKSLGAPEASRGRDSLVKVAITEPDPVVRAIIGHALPELGLKGSTPLMARMGARFNRAGSSAIRGYFAEEALQQFSDNGTARALTSAALTWAGAPQMRAARVLANMPVEAALPQLAWSALNGGNAAERAAAYDLLDRIVRGDARLAVGPHRYGAGQIVSGGLGWFTEIAGRTGARDWTSYPDIAIPVLRGAIGAMPREAASAPTPTSLQEAIKISAGLAPGTGGSLLDTMKRGFSWTGLGEPKLPAVKLTRHPHAEFPANCRLGDNVLLKIRLLPSQADGTLSPFDLPFQQGKETTDLIVIASAQGFGFDESYQKLKVPRDGPSDTAIFHVRAREAGDWVIDVKLILGAEEVCHFVVRSIVNEKPTAGEAVLNPVEHFSEGAPDRHGRIRALFTVKMNHDTEKLEWSLLEPGAAAPRALGESELKFAPAEIAKWNEANAKLITGLVEQDLADLPGAIAQLKADGAELFEQIAPPEIAKELAKLSPADLIVIESDADWVPWELLAVDAKSDLLGERFVLVRSPIVKRGEELPPSAPKTVSPTLREALVIVGNGILNGADLPRQTFGDYAKRAKKPLEQPTWTELQTAVKGKDIVHFVCHGRGTKLYLDYGKDGGSKLLVKQASELGFDPGAVVFANACSSGTASPLLSSFQSFGKEFYLAGARPYIGTLGPVPQSLAVKFSALFYTRFALEGLSAADALRLARVDAAKTFKRPVWLLYCLYGNTSVTRRWSADA